MAKTKKTDGAVNITQTILKGHEYAIKLTNDDWGTVAFKIPRHEIEDSFSDMELRNNCIYILTGLEGTIRKTYVGQAKKRNNGESVLARLREHVKSNTERYSDVWTTVMVFTGKDGAWSLDDLNALEHALYNEIPSERCLNGNEPNSGGADYDRYMDKLVQIRSYIRTFWSDVFMDDVEDRLGNLQVVPGIDVEAGPVEDLQNGTSRIPEIVTPSKVVKEMCDMLPQDVWNDQTTFLDPACKGGEYLREIYDRLMDCELLKAKYPSEIARSNHILLNQLYGIALSEVSKQRTKSNLNEFDLNIRVIPGYVQKLKGVGLGTEPDGASRTICDIINEEFGREMRFDVVIGNPPYQELDGSGLCGGAALYDRFVNLGDSVARHIILIMPTRWMSDIPRGISNQWLKHMRNRSDYKKVVEYTDSSKVFKGVSIAGGVGIIYIDKKYEGPASIDYVTNESIESRLGKLSTLGYVIRNCTVASVVDKVSKVEGKDYTVNKTLGKLIGSTRDFSKSRGTGLSNYLESNWTGFSDVKTARNYIAFYTSDKLVIKGIGFVCEEDLAPGTLELAKRFKCFISRSSGTYIKPPFIGGYDSCCSTKYVPVYGEEIDDESKADSMIKYVRTRFANLLTSALKTTQHVNSQTFSLLPMQDFTSNSDIDWSQSISDIDQQLYRKYGLTQEEISYIERTIKLME